MSSLVWEYDWEKPELEDFTHDINGMELRVESNYRIRPINAELKLTEEHITEIMRCAISPIYFIENYVRIISTDEGEVPFILRPYQKRMLQHIIENRFTANMLPRQAGKSILMAAYATWYITFNQDKFVAYLGHKLAIAQEILLKIRQIYQTLPKWLQQGVINFAKRTVHLENGSRIYAETTGAGAAAGYALSLLILDEFALVGNHKADEFMASVLPTVSASKEAKIAIISTPRGFNHFHTIYNGDNEFQPFSIEWNEVPGRDEEFKAKMIKNMGKIRWNQEFETSFVGSQNTLVEGSVLQDIVTKAPIAYKFDYAMRVFEMPKENRRYIITVDPSQGLGNDDTAISVFDITEFPIRQVASYNSNNISTLSLDGLLKEMGMFYNDALIIIENNNIGADIANRLFYEKDYDNTFGWDPKKESNADFKGVRMTPSVKMKGCLSIKKFIEENKIFLSDEKTIQQFYTFVSHKNTWKAEEGCKDDLAMSCVIAGFFFTLPEFTIYSSGSLNRNVLNKDFDFITGEMSSLWGYDDGTGLSLYDQYHIHEDKEYSIKIESTHKFKHRLGDDINWEKLF